MKVPFYQRVAETLRSRIETRRYHPGELIPSEKELAQEFGVSVITIRKAMDSLVKDGLVNRRPGVGTRVARRQEDPMAIRLTGDFREWFDSVSGKFPKLSIDILDVEITSCPENIAKILQMPPDNNIWRMRRIRKFNNEPVSYYVNYSPPEIFQDVDPKIFKKSSFFKVLQKRYNNRISKLEQRVEAIVADMDLAALLDISFGVPLFFGEIVYYVGKDTPVEVTHLYLRGDRYVYRSVIPLKNKSK